MYEPSKSIWKKSLPKVLLIWGMTLIAVIMLIFIIAIFKHGDTFTGILNSIGLPLCSGIIATFTLCLSFFIRWLWCWRNFKRFLFGLACFVTLIALFYAEEDWRGWHDWNKFKHAWEAKGENFDFASIVPPRVPDDQNFAFSPVWIAEIRYAYLGEERTKVWYGDRIYSDEVSKIAPLVLISVSGLTGTNWSTHLPNTPQDPQGWPAFQTIDLKPWQTYYRDVEKACPAAEISVTPQPQSPAQDILLALGKFDPAIQKLKTDSVLPGSRFPVQYDTDDPAAILLPHLAALKNCSQVLQLRAIAELQNGQTDKAFDDVKLSLRLIDSIRTEPFIITHLVRIAMAEITLQPIYEGLAERKWSDAQLAKLDSELAKPDFLADYKFSMRGEMIFGISETEYLRRTRNLRAMGFDGQGDPSSPPFSNLGFHLAPVSFFYRNELTIAQMHEQWTLPLADLENRIVSPRKVSQNAAVADKALRHGWPYNILARMIFPAIGNAVKRYARGQSSVDLARVAIALERYRLAHGEFPDSLDALAPQFMEKVPHDIINGEPLHYRRDPPSQSSSAAGGQLVLYSVGWNETDDNGTVGLTKNGNVDPDKGDWVWQYPQK